MSHNEHTLLALVDDYTRNLPDYTRGVTSVFALAAYRTGYKQATTERAREASQIGTVERTRQTHHSNTSDA